MSRLVSWGAVALLLSPAALHAAEPDKPASDKIAEVSGSAEFLRSVPKHFATLTAVDPAKRRVTLILEGEKEAKELPLTPDAEVKVAGWWGRLDQLTLNDRVWVWLHTDRDKKPDAVFLLADELSEQDIHGRGVTLVAKDATTITIKPTKGDNRTLKAKSTDGLTDTKPLYVQTQGDTVRLVYDVDAFDKRQAEQKAALAKRWADEGLPGTVTFLHLSGEMEFMLDHEAMRWGRSLQYGDKVTLEVAKPITAVVKSMQPWRERTQVRLVAHGIDQTDLRIGQRTRLKMKPPSEEVQKSPLPPDVDRPRATKAERVEWFLASIYCTCVVKGDGCTGHFYTLASCNPNACGMPNAVRKQIAERIDKGMSDREIFEQMYKEKGRFLVQPHLLP
jgi:hypothetical protein